MVGMSRRAHLLLSSAALAAALAAPRAHAQAEAEAPVFTPPALLEYVEADYPPAAFAAGIEAAVPARLDVDENGLVTAVEILEPAGHGFDEAARDAMLQFVFTPALQDGVAIPSRVDYRYTFFIEKVEPSPEEAAPPAATLSGVVQDMSGLAIPGASIVLTPLGGEAADAAAAPDGGVGDDWRAPATADAKGGFALLGIPPGAYQVDVVASGYKPLGATEELVDGETREVVYRLEREAALYETVVRGRRPPREVTRREITRREITRIPGTGGDALRSVQNLPGMARASFMGGELVVRGSAPGDTDVYFDEMPIPLLYHFGGLTSVVNSDLLERIDFYPGNFSARYGGATGGVIDVYPRMPKTDRLHASLDADFWDASALVETPIGDDWSVAASIRRSYIDAILTAVLPDDGGFQFTVAPRYWDYQAIADYHPSEKDNLRLFVFGSDDKMVFLFGEDMVGNPNFSGDMGIRLYFHQLQARYDHKFSKAVANHLNVGAGLWVNDINAGGMYQLSLTQVPIFLRDEVAIDTGPYFGLRTGVDAEFGWAKWDVVTPMSLPTEGEQFDPITANDQALATSGNRWYYRPAWYAELEMKAIEDLRLIYGLRIDYYAMVRKPGIDPRFVARYEIVDGTTLKGGIGMFHQPPAVEQADADWGNPNLDLIDSVHYSLGAEQVLPKPLEHLEISLEGFFKQLSRLVVSSDAVVERDGETVPERYNNDGRGKVYGLELMVKHNDNGRFFGWIAYTLMKSARVDHPGEPERLFDYDQTHILTVVASAVLGRGWEAGVRFRLVSGNPETPVIGSIYDADSDVYWPLYGEVNSERMPMFHQLDVRVDKNWTFKYLKFGVYIDVQNVYNHKNVEGTNYSYDYKQKAYLVGLPLLPSLGLKLEY
jgi:TonB family protein